MSGDGPNDDEGGNRFRTRRRTRRAKRRPLRVPVDEVPRRSVVDMAVPDAVPPRKTSRRPAPTPEVTPSAPPPAAVAPDVDVAPASQQSSSRPAPEGDGDRSVHESVVVRGSVSVSGPPPASEDGEPIVVPHIPQAPLPVMEVQPAAAKPDAAPAASAPVPASVVEAPPGSSASDAPKESAPAPAAEPQRPADADSGWLEEAGAEITIEPVDPDDEELVGLDVDFDEDLDEPEPTTEEPREPELQTTAAKGRQREVTQEIDASSLSELSEDVDFPADETMEAAPHPVSPEKAASVPPAPPGAQKAAPPPTPPKAEPVQKAETAKAPPRPDEKAAAAAVAANQHRRRPWFETFFNDDYLRTVPPAPYRHVSAQCDFIIERLKLPQGSTILDVGCGLGLHALELRSRGYLVVGLDLSLPMLSRAADEAQDRGVKINFLHSDMREMTFEGAFDAVLCWGTSFGYFDDDTNRLVLGRLFNALKPRGLLLLDVINRDFVVREQPNLVWFEGDGCVCMEETQFNHIKDRLEVKRTVILDDGRQRETYYSIRLYTLHELGHLMHQQGFRVASISGREATPNVFFGADSPRMIMLAERRAEVKKTGSSESRPPKPPPAPTSSQGGTKGATKAAAAEGDDGAEELDVMDVVEEVSYEEAPKEEPTKPDAKALRDSSTGKPPTSSAAQAKAGPTIKEAPEAKPTPEPKLVPEVVTVPDLDNATTDPSSEGYVDDGDTVVGGEFPGVEGDSAGEVEPDAGEEP